MTPVVIQNGQQLGDALDVALKICLEQRYVFLIFDHGEPISCGGEEVPQKLDVLWHREREKNELLVLLVELIVLLWHVEILVLEILPVLGLGWSLMLRSSSERHSRYRACFGLAGMGMSPNCYEC